MISQLVRSFPTFAAPIDKKFYKYGYNDDSCIQESIGCAFGDES